MHTGQQKLFAKPNRLFHCIVQDHRSFKLRIIISYKLTKFQIFHQTTPAWLAQSVERETLRFHLLTEAIDPISRLRVRPPHRAKRFFLHKMIIFGGYGCWSDDLGHMGLDFTIFRFYGYQRRIDFAKQTKYCYPL
jgi:hypothetical protein